jgi:hypothetical protein
MNLAVFEDIRDISPRQGWIPPALVSDWLSDTLNSRYGAIQLARSGGTIQPEGSDYAKLGTSTALTPETLWCLGWMNHDFTLFKPDLSEAEIQKLVEEDEAETGQAAPSTDSEDDEETDEEEDLGQVRLLLGRHWDRKFAAWVRASDDRRAVVRAAYNRSFRGIVVPTYEGGTLDIARWNEHGPQLKAHQIAGILRVLDMRGGLIAFDVGVGKTYTAIGVIAAARQEGWVRRPVVLVPSSLVWKWHDDFLCVLPDYRVQVIGSKRKQISRGKRKGLLTSETDTPEERAEKWSAFQAGLHDVVILSYDALGRTKMNQEALLEYVKTVESLQRQVKLRQRNAAKKKADDLSERERAILKHGVRAFVEEMLELPEGHKFDPGIAWDDIGIDMLIVDEAAAFKNSYKPEAREHGLPKFMGSGGDGSKRAWQLAFRAAAVRQCTGGSGIVLLTATPAKNSPLEFYNLIQLIDPHAFSSRGLMDPEQFIDRFLRIESREIIDMTLKVSMRSVVDGFKNLDDFGIILKRFGEFRTADEAGVILPEPRSEQVRVAMSPDQEDLYGELVRKLERTLQQSQIKGSSQNKILGLLARLSLIALHPRLDGGMEYDKALSSVSPADYAAPKLKACAERVAATAGCGHIIFCESTAVHLWMREVLVAHGVPRDRIAILNAIETQSADRIRIAREFNGISSEPPTPGSCASGSSQRIHPKFDVIIANSVAYEGIDLQTRTCAIHHLDQPWTPADLEQRNGRAVRQGNELPVVRIYYYMSDRSMDWYRYTLIQGKRGWLGDVLASQVRDTSNPGAQQALSDEEILLMISRDPEATQRALDARREAVRAEARHKVAREAANLLVQADARFRDARETTDSERAARLRAEGDERLRDLKRIDAAAWPWARLVERVREVEMMVPSAASPPVFEGLRVGRGKPGAVRYHEFGRVLRGEGERRIGRRAHGFPTWEMLGEQALRTLDLQPADIDAGAGWPDEDDAELQNVLEAHIEQVLGKQVASYEELEWLGASDAWLTRWWPRVEKRVREGLARSTAEVQYPLLVGDALTLASGEKLRRGELLAPTLAGWQRYLELAPTSGLKFGDLREAALAWWERKFPRGLLTVSGGQEAEEEPAAPAESLPVVTPTLDPSPLPEPEPEPAPAAKSEPLPVTKPPTRKARKTGKRAETHAMSSSEPLIRGERIAARFNAEPGPRLRLESHRGQVGLLFVVLREDGGDDEVLAAVDVNEATLESIRWISTRLRPTEQDAIVDHLERVLAEETALEAATDKEPPPDAESSLQPLIRMLERQGFSAFGMDPVHARDTSRKDPLRTLAAALQDLSAPQAASPEEITTWLTDQGLFSVADVLQDASVIAYGSVAEILDRVWTAADVAVPLVKILRQGEETRVDKRAITWSKITASSIVLAREEASGRRYRLRTIKVLLSNCADETCNIIPIQGKAAPGTEVYLLHERQDLFIEQLHERLAELEASLRAAPKLLEDVRHLLFLTGVLIDTQRCQGKEQAAALRAFEQAKGYHDAARRMLIEGKPAVAAERIHAAMRRIATAAAQIAQSCAAGQQSIVPAKLAVSPDDEAELEEEN